MHAEGADVILFKKHKKNYYCFQGARRRWTAVDDNDLARLPGGGGERPSDQATGGGGKLNPNATRPGRAAERRSICTGKSFAAANPT